MVFFILRKQNEHLIASVASEMGRGRCGEPFSVTVTALNWCLDCRTHTDTHKLKGLSLNHLLSETQNRRCTVKHPGEEPKRACEASSNRLELTSVIENVCFLQPGYEERCLRFFYIYIYIYICMYIKFFIVSLKNNKKRLSVKEPLVLRRAPKGPTVRGWKVTLPHPLFWSTWYDP